jgi:hypothetical protein
MYYNTYVLIDGILIIGVYFMFGINRNVKNECENNGNEKCGEKKQYKLVC